MRSPSQAAEESGPRSPMAAQESRGDRPSAVRWALPGSEETTAVSCVNPCLVHPETCDRRYPSRTDRQAPIHGRNWDRPTDASRRIELAWSRSKLHALRPSPTATTQLARGLWSERLPPVLSISSTRRITRARMSPGSDRTTRSRTCARTDLSRPPPVSVTTGRPFAGPAPTAIRNPPCHPRPTPLPGAVAGPRHSRFDLGRVAAIRKGRSTGDRASAPCVAARRHAGDSRPSSQRTPLAVGAGSRDPPDRSPSILARTPRNMAR
jgi:hypothetical protein